MAGLPDDMSIMIDELETAVAEMESRLESARAERDEAKVRQLELEIENANLRRELNLARERQTASAEVLRAISETSGDAERALTQIAEITARLFGAPSATLSIADDNGDTWARTIRVGASSRRIGAEISDALRKVGGRNLPGTVVGENRQIHIPDLDHPDPSVADWPGLPPARAEGTRVMSGTPLRRAGKPIGVLIIYRDRPQPFTEEELELQQSFADQAVVAIENARLFNETREALERQTATAEILKVIAASPSDTTPVFEAIASSANRLLGGFSTAVFRFAEGTAHLKAFTPTNPAADEVLRASFPRPVSEFEPFRLAQHGNPIPIADTEDIQHAQIREIARQRGFRSMLFVPLMSDGLPIGIISVTRLETGTFAPHHVQLLQTFANQAVIAIENTRLFNEVQQRTEDLSESLRQQTAVGDVLKTISRSTFDLQPVLDTLVNSAAQLCGADMAFIMRRVGDEYRAGAAVGYTEAYIDFLMNHPLLVDRGSVTGRTVLEQRPVQILDVVADPEYTLHQTYELANQRTTLGVPLLRENEPIGTIVLARRRVEPFSEKQIDLVATFADQAVIAIENVRLFNEVRQRTEDLTESLQQQTATADVLKLISRSAFDLQAVLDTLTESAARLCDADMGAITLRDERGFYHATNYNFPVDWVRVADVHRLQPGRESVVGRALLAREAVQIADALTDPEYAYSDMQEVAGYRSLLGVPLLRGGEPIGVLFLGRKIVEPYTERQVELVSTFADQAVIAIENVRLFDEVQARTEDLSESLQQQTATAEVLKVISRSAFDLEIVMNTLSRSASELCDAQMSGLFLREGDHLVARGVSDVDPKLEDFVRRTPLTIEDQSYMGHAVLTGNIINLADAVGGTNDGRSLAFQKEFGYRSVLLVPLMRDGRGVGVFALCSNRVGAFSQRQIELVQTFADQAVIAIQNVRLFDEVQARTHDLTEALQQQTATSEVLEVISTSAGELEPVFQKVLQNATRLCGANFGTLSLYEGSMFHNVALYNVPEGFDEQLRRPILPHPESGLSTVAKTHQAMQIDDLRTQPPYLDGDPAVVSLSDLAGARTIVVVPMLREDELIGTIAIFRQEVRPFTDKQVDLVTNFAKQAVIAIENMRLLKELRRRTDDLSESLQQQTATADVLQVISASPGELAPVFRAMLENAVRLCEAKFAMLLLKEGDEFRAVGMWNLPPEYNEFLTRNPIRISPKLPLGRVVETNRAVHVTDVLQDASYLEGFPGMVAVADIGGARTLLQVPMLKEDQLVGTIGIYRQEVRPFTDKQIGLVQNFAAQAVIAIENARLLNELRQRTADLSQSLDDLRTAQDRLVQTEKLASLGQLTAGIAHEIKNPLNFVNNFAALSSELTEELRDVLKPAGLGDKMRTEVDELTGLLKDNLEKVVQHGKRADSIVRNMLLHSREGGGEHRPSDINALIDESLNLAYHGARAEKPDFNVTIQRDFDPAAGQVDLFPQEITRVILNLVSNGFYAVTKRRKDGSEPGFEPTLWASTRNLGESVEIRIRDNGTGIPPEVREKMFNPFFTTKPAGEGTGLGLSMSHDIIVKQHGGTIDVDSSPGDFTDFRIVLPRTSNFTDKSRG